MRSGSFSLRVLITARCGFTIGVASTPGVGLDVNRSALSTQMALIFYLFN